MDALILIFVEIMRKTKFFTISKTKFFKSPSETRWNYNKGNNLIILKSQRF